MEVVSIVILSLSSFLLLFVGSSRLSNPIATYAKNSGITLAKDVDLLNEVRGLSAVMLCAGILTVLGTFLSQMTFTAHVVGALIFLGFALGRFISMSADGKPNQQIISGIVFELVLGAGNVVGLVLG